MAEKDKEETSDALEINIEINYACQHQEPVSQIVGHFLDISWPVRVRLWRVHTGLLIQRSTASGVAQNMPLFGSIFFMGFDLFSFLHK